MKSLHYWLLLVVIVAAYQNCSQVIFAPVDGSKNKKSFGAELDSGNGGMYDGKPEGVYVRTVPDWTCESNINSEYARLNIANDESPAQLTVNAKDMCGLKKPNVPVEQINVFPEGNDVVAYKEGLYQRQLQGSEPSRFGPAEAWCSSISDNERLDVLISQDEGAYKATVVRGTKKLSKWQKQTNEFTGATASISGAVRSYKHSSIELDVDFRRDSASTVLQYDGVVKLNENGASTIKKVGCRTARQYDPVVNATYCDLRAGNAPFANSGEPGIDGSTMDKAFTICTAEQLNNIGADELHWDRSFVFKGDIDMATLGATPFNVIGRSDTKFTGSIDGLDHQIKNIFVKDITPDTFTGHLGLIGVAKDATISDLAVSNAVIDGDPSLDSFVGGVVGFFESGVLSGLRFTGSVTGNSKVGGIVGYAMGRSSITHSHSRLKLSGYSQVGGLGGFIKGTTISHSSASGQVIAYYGAGGLVGWVRAGSLIEFSSADVNVMVAARTSTFQLDWGGLAGLNLGTIRNSFATGNVEGVQRVGGLVGFGGQVKNSFSTGTVAGLTEVGGLLGVVGLSVENSYALGNVYATGEYVGGLVGRGGATEEIRNCFAQNSVSGVSSTDAVGPLVGLFTGVLSNAVYDSAQPCAAGLGTCNTLATAIDTTSDAGYFYEPSNAPMDAWDFVNIWISDALAYPELR